MKQLHFQPIAGKAQDILDVLLHTPEVASCKKEFGALRLVCEELLVNMVDYAYPEEVEGYLDIEIEREPEFDSVQPRQDTNGYIVIRFKDGGTPFDPLAKELPDVTLHLEDRRIGGLGIFLVVKKMDEVFYEYVNNENVSTIKKTILQ
jgi:anti-sigma regulatory factor (Ser/Thr protein kinase)